MTEIQKGKKVLSNWNTVKLSEAVKIIGGGTPKTSVPKYWDGSIPWLSPPDFNNSNRYVEKTKRTITEEGLILKLSKKRLKIWRKN